MNYNKGYLRDASNLAKGNAFSYHPKTTKNSLSKNFQFTSANMSKMIK
jgi:hypothetical protein